MVKQRTKPASSRGNTGKSTKPDSGYTTNEKASVGKKIKIKFKTKKQKDYANLIKDKEITFSSGPAGVGKAQLLDSIILTPNGSKKFKDIKIGDSVLTPDGKTSKVIQIHPQGKIDMFLIEFNDKTSTICSGGHLWFTQTYNERNHRVREKGNRDNRYSSPKKGEVRSTLEIMETLTTNRGDKNHSIPITKPIQYSEKKLLIHPYIMGCLLGDGGLTQGVRFTSADEEVVNYVKDFLPKDVFVNKYANKYGYSIISDDKINTVLDEIKDLKLFGLKSEDKFIPNDYLINSISNRIYLLQGLMDTDGTVNKCGTNVSFCTVSEKLKDGIKSLVQSLGGVVRISTKIPRYKDKNNKKVEGKLAYIITIVLNSDISPFKLIRKSERVRPKTKYRPKRYIVNVTPYSKEEALCISIDSDTQLYLTNDFIVTHNSYVAIGVAIELLQDEDTPYKKILIVKPAVEAEEQLGFLPGDLKEKLAPYLASSIDIVDKIMGKPHRIALENTEELSAEPLGFIRGKTIDNSVVIIEEAQNISPAQMKTLLTRIGSNSKYIISGDLDQSDRYDRVEKSGLYDAINRHSNIEEIGFLVFDNADIVRNPLIGRMLDNYVVQDKNIL